MGNSPTDAVIEVLRERPEVRLVYLFGSRATGRPRPESDFDVALLLASPPDFDAERAIRSLVASAAGDEVDLVVLNDAGVVLRHEVATTGRCLFARDEREQAEFEILAISQYLDFQPVLRLQEEYLRARVEERRRGASG